MRPASTARFTQQSASRATVAIRVMAGAGRPSTTFLVASSLVVDGGPAPAMTAVGSVALPPDFTVTRHPDPTCHCEERSDEATSVAAPSKQSTHPCDRDCFIATLLAMASGDPRVRQALTPASSSTRQNPASPLPLPPGITRPAGAHAPLLP